MGRIALVVPNNLWVCPYISNYSRILDKEGAEYEIISWNRAGKEEKGIQYNKQETTRSLIGVLWSYLKFAGFVKKTLVAGQYERVVVFSPQLAIFMVNFLKKHYRGRYILDYRDLSIEQKPLLGYLFKSALRNSYANVVSSPGFLQYLPKAFEYVVSHNFNLDRVSSVSVGNMNQVTGGCVKVLTIGAIREDRNIEVIDALGNVDGFELQFVGKGIAAKSLEEYARNKGYKNVSFTGYYEKKEEPRIIEGCALINIVYPLIPSHISALSNRFYNSLIFKRPMVVTKNTIQGDYAEKYGVGLVVDTCDHLGDKILAYLAHLDYTDYCERCERLLDAFVEENHHFENVISGFVRDAS